MALSAGNLVTVSDYNTLKTIFPGSFYSSMTGKRSSSVKSIDLLTEAMIKTVL